MDISLSSRDLYTTHDNFANLKKQTYDKVYRRCVNIIKLTAKAGQLWCVFEIPPFVFGSEFPLINVTSCANYIMDRLIRSNKHIKAKFIPDNNILISWYRDEDL